jgi:uncharacterized protein YggE
MKNLILAPLLFLAFGLSAAEKPNFPFVAASGSANIEVKPDEASIRLEFLSHHAESESAMKGLGVSFATAIEVVAEHGVPEENLKASDITKRAIRRRLQDEYRDLEILGYDITRNLTIKLKDLTKYPALAESLTRIDGVESIRSTFSNSNDEKIKLDLITEACSDAKIEAARLAEGLGMKLGKPYAIKQDHTLDSSWATFGLDSTFEGVAPSWAPGGAGSAYEMKYFVPEKINRNSLVHVIFRLDD